MSDVELEQQSAQTPAEELTLLQDQAEALEESLLRIKRRITELSPNADHDR